MNDNYGHNGGPSLSKMFNTNRKVQVMRDHKLDVPHLYMDVFVAGASDWEHAMFASMFARASCKKADSPDNADLVVFNGGVDVNPELYGEARHPYTEKPDHARDQADMQLYLYCRERGIPMLGICRGAQFLHVMNGGKLYQHVDNHNTAHPMWDLINRVRIEKISSVHHQMVRSNPEGGMKVLAVANKSSYRWKNPIEKSEGNHSDIEAFFYRDTCCLGIQGHPEYAGYPRFTQWALDTIYHNIVVNPDIKLQERNYRILPDLLKQRLEGFAVEPEPVQSIIIPGDLNEGTN